MHYFGATSNLHIIHNGQFSLFRPEIATLNSDILFAAGLDWAVDTIYVDSLLHLYFTWENPFMNTVDRSIFTRERQRYEWGKSTALFSPTLENAM